jgi:hypothetical protein
MNIIQHKYILKNKKWKFSFLDHLNKYFILIVPAGFIILGLHPLFDKEVFQRMKLSNFLSFFPFYLLLVGALLLIVSYRRVESERKFRKIELLNSITAKEVSFIVNEVGWSVTDVKQDYIVAETDWSAFSWGEEITIILCDDYLLINSRSTGSQPFTLGRDIYNYKKLKEYLALNLASK